MERFSTGCLPLIFVVSALRNKRQKEWSEATARIRFSSKRRETGPERSQNRLVTERMKDEPGRHEATGGRQQAIENATDASRLKPALGSLSNSIGRQSMKGCVSRSMGRSPYLLRKQPGAIRFFSAFGKFSFAVIEDTKVAE